MAYDYQGALNAGADPNSVATYLANKQGYDLKGALGAGADVHDVIRYLSSKDSPVATPTPDVTPPEQGTLASIGSSVIQAPQRLGQGIQNIVAPAVNKIGQTLGATGNIVPENQATGTDIFGGKVDTLGYKDGQHLQGTELAKDVAGNALQNASLLIPGGAELKGLSTAAKIGEAAKVGAATGGLYGAGQAMQNQDSATGVLGSTLEGAVTGAALGGAIPATGAGVSAIKNSIANRAENKVINQFDSIANLISPKVTPTTAEDLITKKSGGIMGINQHDIIDYSNNPQIKNAVEAVKDIVNPSETAGTNKNLVLGTINNISENQVKPFLKENPVPFNFQDLRNSFDQVQPSSALKADPSAFANYSRVKEDLLNTIAGKIKSITANPNNLTDMNELWDARKLVDKKINQELNMNLGDAQYAGAKAAAQDFRQQFSSFIKDSLLYPGMMEKVNKANEILGHMSSIGQDITPEMKDALYTRFGINPTMVDEARSAAFSNAMDKMSSMYTAVDGLSTKIKGDLGKSTISRVVKAVKDHPVAAIGASAVGAYELGKTISR
jgi:hypothetical protein